jgi:hypothetical protein
MIERSGKHFCAGMGLSSNPTDLSRPWRDWFSFQPSRQCLPGYFHAPLAGLRVSVPEFR